MYTRTVKIINPTGLHARPGSAFVDEAKKYRSKITIRRLDEDEEPVNAKSIAFVLSLGVGRGVEIELTADGPDENEALDSLVPLIESGLGEKLE